VGSKVWQLDRKWQSHPSKFSIIWSNNVRINECIWLFVKMWLICKNRRKKKIRTANYFKNIVKYILHDRSYCDRFKWPRVKSI
jgi:hypothetical protein